MNRKKNISKEDLIKEITTADAKLINLQREIKEKLSNSEQQSPILENINGQAVTWNKLLLLLENSTTEESLKEILRLSFTAFTQCKMRTDIIIAILQAKQFDSRVLSLTKSYHDDLANVCDNLLKEYKVS